MKDLTGQRFGRLVAVEPTDRRNRGLVVWRCKCDCGRECEVVGAQLSKGATRSCGCLRDEAHSLDLTGQRFGRLVAVKRTDRRVRGSVVWECACDCGNTCEQPASMLRAGQARSCGCLRAEVVRRDLAGQRFGKLVAVRPAGRRGRSVVWECRCDCGNTKLATTSHLTSGKVRSCGCLRGSGARTGAGETRTRGRSSSNPLPKNLAGRRFGSLTAIEPTDARDRGSVVWRCICECGSFCEVSRRRLADGSATSCGCC